MEQITPNSTNEEESHHENDSKVTSDLSQATQGRMRHKKLIITLVVAIVIVGALAALAFRYKALFVAAMVDKHAISRLSVIHELERRGGKETLDLLISKQLIKNEAQAKGITVTDDEVNAEIKKYEDLYSVQGNTLDKTLEAQGLTRQDLKDQITIQKQIEKLSGDKGNVTDEEVESYITTNKVPVEAGKEEQTRNDIRDSIKQDKLGEFSNQLIIDLKAKANIKTYITY